MGLAFAGSTGFMLFDAHVRDNIIPFYGTMGTIEGINVAFKVPKL